MSDDLRDPAQRPVTSQTAAINLAARQRAEAALQQAKAALQQAKAALELKTEEFEGETRVLELLNETGKIIGSTLDFQTLLQAITDRATQLCSAQFGAFFYTVKNEKDETLLLYTLSGAPREKFESFGHPRATELFGPTFRGEKPIRIDDVKLDPRYGKMGPHFGMPSGHLPVCSYLAVPVFARSGEVIGGLFFGHSEAARFSERSERLIVGVAAQASMAIDNARLYEGAKRAAVEAERTSFMKDEFLATLSHELRTPLNAIMGWSQILASGDYEPQDLAAGIEAIGRNARAQTQLIEDLLDMSRIISGKIRLDMRELDLVEVIDAAITSIRPSAEAKKLEVRKTLDPTAGPVTGDPNRMQQVVWNLLANAVKFTPQGGRIDVLLQRDGTQATVTVRDTGIGIRPDFLPHVFERFRQADSSVTRRFGGLGIGLSIVNHLTELHGGSVRVESAGESRGATFVVSLPLATAGAAAQPKTVPLAVHLEGVKVLIVDDESDARDLLRLFLTRNRAEVVSASSADEGLALLEKERPDVVISDIGMPDRDGYQFVRDMRSRSSASGGMTPAIALTAFARAEDRTRAMLAGFQAHLPKPVESVELVALVASLASPMGKRR